MGADIHLYMEVCEDPASDNPYWSAFGGRVNPGRDYGMFGVIADVRVSDINIIPPKGMPEGRLGYEAEGDAYLYVNDKHADQAGYCSVANADEWVKSGSSANLVENGVRRVTNPDWHSHTWLTPAEFRQCLQTMEEKAAAEPDNWGNIDHRYYAVAAALEALEGEGREARAVIWFDN
jgi:hypothetical protein